MCVYCIFPQGGILVSLYIPLLIFSLCAIYTKPLFDSCLIPEYFILYIILILYTSILYTILIPYTIFVTGVLRTQGPSTQTFSQSNRKNLYFLGNVLGPTLY